MVKNEIAPRLRELGLKGSGQKFRLPPETHLHSHRERLGFLSRGRDHWWEVPADGPTLKIAGEVIHDISEFGIPWLRAQTQADFTIPWLRRHAKA